MSVYFISDPHFGHSNIADFRPLDYGPDCDLVITDPLTRTRTVIPNADANTRLIVDYWQRTVKKSTSFHKQDIVFCLGDVAFNEDALRLVHSLNGRKILIGGNHDYACPFASEVYWQQHGMLRYKGFWLTHCPIHPAELRGKPNAHGHVHEHTLADPRYFNLCVESLLKKFGKPMISLDELRNWRDEYVSPLHA
jgi:calcineurin-like phosphoesterase family protein